MEITDTAQHEPDLESYDHILVAFSGGKDSLACLLHLFELGVPKEKIELHHHDVDGGNPLMDWPVTPSYCNAVAAALDLPIYHSYRVGGFEREMLRNNTPTAPVFFQSPSDRGPNPPLVGGKGTNGTRLQFPQVSADLSVRWCSAYLKIDVMAALIRNDRRFDGKRVLVITGERAEESAARARYKRFEPHRSDLRNGRRPRHIDAWRPVHAWTREQVWFIIRRHGVIPHPAYYLGWARLSCMCCIFGSPNQWASVRAISTERFDRIASYELTFGKTIHRSRSVIEQADKGTTYPALLQNPDLMMEAMQQVYNLPVLCEPADWQMPAGAFGEDVGPT